jgi:hypothetical protein
MFARENKRKLLLGLGGTSDIHGFASSREAVWVFAGGVREGGLSYYCPAVINSNNYLQCIYRIPLETSDVVDDMDYLLSCWPP